MTNLFVIRLIKFVTECTWINDKCSFNKYITVPEKAFCKHILKNRIRVKNNNKK